MASTPSAVPTLLPTSTSTLIPTVLPTPTDDVRVLNPDSQHVYLYVFDRKNWHEAVDDCESRGGYLVTIHSESENEFVFDLAMENDYVSIWLGASDQDEEGVWTWANGEPWDYETWESGEPNNCHRVNGECVDEDYLIFWEAGNPNWNDIPSGSKPYVCEWEGLGS